MANGCRVCKSHEEIYWSKFRDVQFLLRLSDNSGDALALPMDFVTNVRENLGESVVLKTPSGSEWVVELRTIGDGFLSLKGTGWKKFVEAHCLAKEDTLIFKYHGNSKFDVTMFDDKTGREKVCSYFVRKEDPIIFEKESARKVVVDGNGDDDKLISSRKKNNMNCRKKRSRRSCEDDSGYLGSSRKGKKICTNMRADVLADELPPRRRIVTELEKKLTKQRAEKEKKDEDTVVRMYPSYVHSRDSLVLSPKWANKHRLNNGQEVELLANGKSWNAKFYYNTGLARAGLTRGWKAFVVDNRVQEGDACLFRVLPGLRDPITLVVRIFRAADNDTRECEPCPNSSKTKA